VVAVSFEVQDGVHHVLEHAGTGDRPVFGHVSDEDRRDTQVLGDPHEPRGRRTHLPHAARGSGELGVERGLDRVHHQKVGGLLPDRRLKRDDVGLGHELHAFGGRAGSTGPHADLSRRLLATRVEHPAAGARDAGSHLEQDRGLADAGLPAEQDERPGHESAAEHTVELAHAGRRAALLRLADLGERDPSAAREGREAPDRPGTGSASSTNVPYSPQSGQRPYHFGALAPHD
jgi:hypothetical protein